jgi:hypothetical protein
MPRHQLDEEVEGDRYIKMIVIIMSVILTGGSVTAAAFNTFETVKLHETTYNEIARRLDGIEKKQDDVSNKLNQLIKEK